MDKRLNSHLKYKIPLDFHLEEFYIVSSNDNSIIAIINIIVYAIQQGLQ